MQPVSGGTCQPDIITMWHALKGTDYDLGIDLNKIHYDKVLVSHEFPEEYFTNEVFNIKEINVNLEKTDHYDFHQSKMARWYE